MASHEQQVIDHGLLEQLERLVKTNPADSNLPDDHDVVIAAREIARDRGYGKFQLENLMIEHQDYAKGILMGTTPLDECVRELSEKTPPNPVSPIEDRKVARQVLATYIVSYWHFLRGILNHHEELIRKRWMKKNRSQRETILLKAWPDMNARHRADVEVFFARSSFTEQQADEALRHPYINLEDLLRPRALLIFLNSRGRNSPSEFSYSDLELSPMYKLHPGFLAKRTGRYTMNFIGDTTRYGDFIQWGDDSAAEKSIEQGLTVHVEHGMQIMTIQYHIMRFLVGCVKQILHDSEKLDWTSPKPKPPPLLDNDGPYISQTVLARDAPYQLPAKPDFTRLYALVSAQKDQAIEHVWALREDPGYFADCALDISNHRIHLVPYADGRLHRMAMDANCQGKHFKVMASDAYSLAFVWHGINSRIAKLRDLSTKYTHTIRFGQSLPPDYFELLVETQVFLECVMPDFLGNIKRKYTASPPLRPYHRTINLDEANPIKMHVQHIRGDMKDETLDRVLELLGLFFDPVNRDILTLNVIMDALDRLMEDNPRAKSFITPHVASYISQLSVICQCLFHLRQFQPWARSVEQSIKERRIELTLERDRPFMFWDRICTCHQYDPNLARLGNPRDGKFSYPVHKPRTQETVNAMRKAETALDSFWKAANSHWLRVAGKTPESAVKEIIGQRVI
jgi:hypothetical protein